MIFDLLSVAFVWPFGSGWMLLFGLAAAIPIIIHLWNRRRYTEVPWAAMQYLMAAMRRNSRRLTIEQLILLAIRVLILLLLALALADPLLPFFSSLTVGLQSGGQTHWVLVIDGSYSMNYQPSDKTRFEVAKQLASQLVDESSQGDGFTLVLMSEPPQVIIRQPAFARDDVFEEIDNLRLPHGGGNLSATLAEVEKILYVADEKHPRLAHRKICIFSDLGRTTWDEVETTACRTRISRLAERATLVLLDLGQQDQYNLAVTRLDARQSLATVSRDLTFQAEIQNFGPKQMKGTRVEILVDGHHVKEANMDVPAHDRASVSLVHRFDSPGEHFVEVRLADDPLDIDNHRWLSVPVRSSIRVLCIEGKPGSAKYVALALQPDKVTRPRVQVTKAPDSAIVESDLDQFDCVFLCNVGRFGKDDRAVLHEYLKNGGGLVFFLGDQVESENYNRHLGGRSSSERVLPARLDEVMAEAQYRLDPLEYQHELVNPFRGHEQSGLLTTPVWKYFKLHPYDSISSKIALAFEGGDPALVEEKLLHGRSIIFASAASGDSLDRLTNTPWTALHVWPSFPPLIQEILSLAVRGKVLGRNVQVGDVLEGVVHGTVNDIPLSLAMADGRTERIKMTVDGDNGRWFYEDTYQSGMYEMRVGPPTNSTEKFAVNLNTRESSLARFDTELLPSQFSQDIKIDSDSQPELPSTNHTQVFQIILLSLLLLLGCESFLAWLFGKATG